MLFLSHEWGPTIVIGNLDIKTAFDSIDHSILFHALIGRGLQEHLAAAFLRELMDIEIDVEIPAMCEASGIRANTGGKQGGTDTTALWNYLIEWIMEDVVGEWNRA
eukprot:5647854-Karenia_brevis.AAC.1